MQDLTTIKESYLLQNYWEHIYQVAQAFASKPFLVTTKGLLNYSEVNRLSNIISASIKSNASLKGVGVGVFLKDPLQVAPAMVGIVKSGNYIVPLDISYPETTLKGMAQTADIKLIITNRVLEDLAGVYFRNLPIIFYDDTIKGLQGQGTENPTVYYKPEDVVQILFTSGSTGTPKGAIEDYRYLIRAIFNRIQSNYYDVDERHLQLSTFSFSGPHIRLFLTLTTGNSLYYYDIKEDGMAGLPTWIKQQQITYFSATPTLFRSFVSTLHPEDTFPTVNKFSNGGEKKRISDIEAVRKHFPNVKKIRLGFGATETQNVAGSYVPIDYDFPRDAIPSGKPSPGVQVFIWDENGRDVPAGTEGEIVVHSDALVRGYINEPELTAAKFIADQMRPGWQYYKTGDLGKLLPDGQLVHLGRLDNMVKIKGVRIEVDAIERLVLSYPGIEQVVSQAIEDARGNKRLATYFVAEPGIQIPVSDLRKRLAEQFPRHQLPHYLVQINEIPMITGRGKVDRSRLPAPNMTRPALSYPKVNANSPLEETLTRIWEDEIGVSGIGATDDFFDIGGDSLIGVLLFARIEKELGKNLPVSILLTASTIRQQAELIQADDVSQVNTLMIPIRSSGARPALFFVPGKGGYPTRVKNLGSKLHDQIPVYAFQLPANVGNDNHQNRTQSLASLYINLIRAAQINGPYILVGESYGGKVAYEMAQQLATLGEKVETVVLLDTYNMPPTVKKGYGRQKSTEYYWTLIKKHLFILLKADPKGRREYLQFYRENGIPKLSEFLADVWNFITKREKPVPARQTALPGDILDLEMLNMAESDLYTPRPYAGHVILYKALRGPNTQYPANGWDDAGIGELIIHPIDCYHAGMLFDPAVSQVAKHLQAFLDESGTGTATQ